VVSRVKALDLRLLTAKREGSKKARERLDTISISTLQPERPMDLLQIDHTPVDVMVVDQRRRLPIGRPWLTLAIDVRTRMVAGFHVSLWSPSTISLSLALSQAVLPKDSWLADRELQTLDWPVHGSLQSLSDSTGGEVYFVSKKLPLRAIFTTIAGRIHTAYELGYTPSSDVVPDSYHRLDLKTKDKHL
jgi:putative transposase